jgi:hypothetical protein
MSRPLADVQQDAFAWLDTFAGFCQVFTINRDGFPTGRTMGGPINADWSVDLIQGQTGFDRVNQVRANNRLELLWIDTAERVPKAVFLRGTGEIYEGDRVVDEYNRRMERNASRGRPAAHVLSADEVKATLIGIKVTPVRIRVEGFGERSEVYAWNP